MIWQKDSWHVLIYKDLGEKNSGELSLWRSKTAEWLQRLEDKCAYAQALVGPAQCQLNYYRQGYNYCNWLERNVVSEEKNIYFMDYIDRYISSLLPMPELHNILNVYDYSLNEKTKADILRITGALFRNNYNMASASKELFIHKNTLALHVNKLRELLDIDPLHSAKDRLFLNCLWIYLKANTHD